MREVVLFNDDYTFEKNGQIEKISLPHTWNAVDGQGRADYY